tara:strand:- start:4629 stop:5114 length:486 start_codon:yes stop_codon:yes gene_type:complete
MYFLLLLQCILTVLLTQKSRARYSRQEPQTNNTVFHLLLLILLCMALGTLSIFIFFYFDWNVYLYQINFYLFILNISLVLSVVFGFYLWPQPHKKKISLIESIQAELPIALYIVLVFSFDIYLKTFEGSYYGLFISFLNNFGLVLLINRKINITNNTIYNI